MKPNLRKLRRRPRAKDLICTSHRRRLTMIGAGSVMDLSGRGTRIAFEQVRAEMSRCAACAALQLDRTDAAR